MKIIKFEKESCNPCMMVSNWLNNNDIKHESLNPFTDSKAQELAIKYQIGMTVPVTVLLNEAGDKVDLVRGYNVDLLEELVSQL